MPNYASGGTIAYKKPKWDEMEIEEKMTVVIESIKGMKKMMESFLKSIESLHIHTHDENGNSVTVRRTSESMYDGPETTNRFQIPLDGIDFSPADSNKP